MIELLEVWASLGLIAFLLGYLIDIISKNPLAKIDKEFITVLSLYLVSGPIGFILTGIHAIDQLD